MVEQGSEPMCVLIKSNDQYCTFSKTGLMMTFELNNAYLNLKLESHY